VEQDLGIGLAPQIVAALFEMSTELLVVIDLAIERHDQGALRSLATKAQFHGLGPLIAQTDDGEPPMA
jgi:hypothetical protein